MNLNPFSFIKSKKVQRLQEQVSNQKEEIAKQQIALDSGAKKNEEFKSTARDHGEQLLFFRYR